MSRPFKVGDIVNGNDGGVKKSSKPIDKIIARLFFVDSFPFYEDELTLITPTDDIGYKDQFTPWEPTKEVTSKPHIVSRSTIDINGFILTMTEQ